MPSRILFSILLCLSFFTISSINTRASAEDINVRAKIGIQIKSNESVLLAKSKDRLKAGDLFRIYVNTEKSCFVYIIHSDGKTVGLLNITRQQVQSATIILPSAQAYYEADGSSDLEMITILCSPQRLPELDVLENDEITPSKWRLIQDDLIQKSQILKSAQDETPFSIAGNVRGMSSAKTDDSFIKKLRIYSGKGLLIRNYEFKIKK